jgi:hypothetical protein
MHPTSSDPAGVCRPDVEAPTPAKLAACWTWSRSASNLVCSKVTVDHGDGHRRQAECVSVAIGEPAQRKPFDAVAHSAAVSQRLDHSAGAG